MHDYTMVTSMVTSYSAFHITKEYLKKSRFSFHCTQHFENGNNKRIIFTVCLVLIWRKNVHEIFPIKMSVRFLKSTKVYSHRCYFFVVCYYLKKINLRFEEIIIP